MDAASRFLVENAHIISFVNGLTFFVLGLSVALEIGRASTLGLREPLKWLSCYGFMASLANWLRLFILTDMPASAAGSRFLDVARLVSFVVAALFLLRFATKLIANTHPRFGAVRWGPALLGGVFAAVLWAILSRPGAIESGWITTADRYNRSLLLFPGLALSSIAMWGQYRHFSSTSLPSIARDRLGAAVAFGVKAVASGLVTFPIFGSAGTLPATAVLGLRIVRMVANGAVAFFVVRSLRFFEVDRRRQLDRAVEQQLEAQQEAIQAQHHAHAEVERWARKLEDLINTIGSVTDKPAEIKEVLDVSLGKVLELTKFEAGHICLVQNGGSEIQRVVQKGLPLPQQGCKACLQVDEEMRNGIHSLEQIVVLPNPYDDASLAGRPCHESGFRLLVSIPITNRGNRLGIMHLLSGDERVLQAYELGVLPAIGQQIGVVIENARLYEQVQSLAAIEERERLSRELHDGLAQVLGYVHVKSKAAWLLLASGQMGQAQEELAEMQEVAQETLREVRESILGLRTTITPASGLIPTIVEYVHRFGKQSGIRTQVTIGDEVQLNLSSLAEVQLLRIVQEALMNIKKHARASQAWIAFEVDGERAIITIEDNGCGFDLEESEKARGGHFGLQTMKERTESVGGEFEIVARSGAGTRVIARLPLNGIGVQSS